MAVHAGFGQAAVTQALLDANFESHTLGAALGTGGAEAGEPVYLDFLSTEVIAATGGGQAVSVSNQGSTSSARRLRFNLLGNAGISSGILRYRFSFTPSGFDRYSVMVREPGGAMRNFLTLNIANNGAFSATDAAGAIALAPVAFAAGAPLLFDLAYDQSAGTHSLSINGGVVYANRAHGLAGQALGSLLIGYQATAQGRAFVLDEVRADYSPQLDEALYADFEDKTIDEAIATGGAAAGEPTQVAPTLLTRIVAQGQANQALRVQAPQGTGVTQSLRWEWLDRIEVATGVFVIEFDFQAEVLDQYQFRVREAGSSGSRNFGSVRLSETGDIFFDDAAGFIPFTLGQYVAGSLHHVRLEYDLDARTVDLFWDGVELMCQRSFGLPTGGIGALFISVPSTTPYGATYRIDNLRAAGNEVRNIASDLLYLQPPGDALVGSPIAPTVEVAVLNVFDEPVASGMPIQLARGQGPAAAFTGVDAVASAGVAAFPALQGDLAGEFTLVAQGDGLSVESPAFMLLDVPPAQIRFVQAPTPVARAVAMAPAVSVEVLDAGGQPVADGVHVRLAISAGPQANLGGASARTLNGVAEFPQITLDAVGSYRLSATTLGGLAVESADFEVLPAPGEPATLVFLQQPSQVAIDTAMLPSVQVRVLDAYADPVADGLTVSLDILSGPAATLQGNSATTVGGVATFSALSVDQLGSYTLRASVANGPSVDSAGFDVLLPPGVPTTLRFVQQPGAAMAGQVISPAVQVELLDAWGIAVDDGFVVHLAIASGPSAQLSGAAAATVAGIATFSDLSIDQAGSFSLRASASTAQPVDSAVFSVAPAAVPSAFADGFE